MHIHMKQNHELKYNFAPEKENKRKEKKSKKLPKLVIRKFLSRSVSIFNGK